MIFLLAFYLAEKQITVAHSLEVRKGYIFISFYKQYENDGMHISHGVRFSVLDGL